MGILLPAPPPLGTFSGHPRELPSWAPGVRSSRRLAESTGKKNHGQTQRPTGGLPAQRTNQRGIKKYWLKPSKHEGLRSATQRNFPVTKHWIRKDCQGRGDIPVCSAPTGLDDTPGVDTVSLSCTHQLHFLIWKMGLKIASPSECHTEFGM